MSKIKLMYKLDQRGAIQYIILLILLAGIAVGVYLLTSGNPLKLFSKASNPPITFKDAQGNPLPKEGELPVTTEGSVQIELEAPPAP